MSWIKGLFSRTALEESPPASEINIEAEKLRRISSLTGDEKKAFEWFRQGYTARWTAETMLLNRKITKRLFSSVFQKLGVLDEAEVCKFYRTIPLKPEDIPPEDDSI